MELNLTTYSTHTSAKPAVNEPLPQTIETTPDFARFGHWTEQVTVIRDGGLRKMAATLATHDNRRTMSSDKLWAECCQTNEHLACKYQIVSLDSPSFFLPKGESVFKVVENPVQLPDNPPQGVMMRHLEAMNAHPTATFYLLEPVFTVDPNLRLLTAEELRQEAAGDQDDAHRLAHYLGWAFRTAAWTRARSVDLARYSIRLATRVIESIASRLIVPSELQPNSDIPFGYSEDSMDVMARQIVGNGLEHDSKRFQRAVAELRWRMSIDPILCFELPERPGELWFESHWFTGTDGKRYVHY